MENARAAAAAAVLSVLALLSPMLSTDVAASPGSAGATERYIVVLHDDVDSNQAAEDHRRDHGARVDLIYRHALRGYAGTMSRQAAARVAMDRRVASIEVDQVVHVTSEMPTGVDRIVDPATSSGTVAHLKIDGKDDFRVDVDVAVIDTGIDHTHPDLNVVAGADCTGGGPFNNKCATTLPGDGNGHGTHVAGTIAALDNGAGVVGVAPGARLHAVKVLRNDGSGYMSWITAGVDWVTARASTISVANMSLGCQCTSSALDTALTNSVGAGVVYAVAAGNSNLDLAKNVYSPAGHPDVITVSALSDGDGVAGAKVPPTCRSGEGDDVSASFTNWDSSGEVVDIAAPGVCIRSTVPKGGYAQYSGTSMASPHVAGAAALLTSQSDPTTKAHADAVRSTLVSEGNTGWTDTKDAVRERLLDVSDASVFTPRFVAVSSGSNAAPTAAFTASCTELTCTFDGSSTDSDGSISSYSWDFGDTKTGTGVNVDHTYAGAGDFTVVLTVTDADGATDTDTKVVTVSGSTTTSPTLTAVGSKEKGLQKVDLSWKYLSTAGSFLVYRDNKVVRTVSSGDTSWRDNIDKRGGATYVYKVCDDNADTTKQVCTNEATVNF